MYRKMVNTSHTPQSPTGTDVQTGYHFLSEPVHHTHVLQHVKHVHSEI
jgi:hypothetical protein